MKIEKLFRQKTHNLKFGINQINNKSKSGISIVLLPLKTVIVPAPSDTGANISVSNYKTIIHNFFEYDSPADVISLVAVGQGTMKIISDQGSVMSWSILYTPSSTGTMISIDHYHQSNISRYI